MKKVLGLLTTLFLLFALATSIALVVTDYQIKRDIDGWKDRAQVSSEPNDMHEWMSNVESGLDSRGMNSGYAALIYKTPSNDMSLIYRTVSQHVDQALVLTEMDRSSPEYQTGLDNLRGSIRELELHSYKYWSVTDGLIINILCIITWILFFVFVIWWSLEY